jgi:hypothetical protein
MASRVSSLGKMYLKKSGAWDQTKRGEAYLKQAGVQREVENIFLKHGGEWFPMFPMIAPARWGYAPFAGLDLLQSGASSVADFLDNHINNLMPDHDDGTRFTVQLPDAVTYCYFAYPTIMGDAAAFLDTVSMFTGGWDGATWSFDPFSDMTFLNMGPLTVQYDGGRGVEDFYVYRTDYQGPSAALPWAVSYPNRPANS